jgi:putative transcriptional regulator
VTSVIPFLPPPYTPVPSYHPGEELLLDYASGGSSPAEAMMIATHLACCMACRDLVRVADDVGGALLDAIASVRLPPDMLNRTLVAIDTFRPDAHDGRAPPIMLDDYLARPNWKKLPGGFRMRRISGNDGSGAGRIWLFDAPPGMRLLPHRHGGDEWTVILRGGFVDQNLHYGPGDFACMADGVVHQPTVGVNERCVSLIMVRENPRYTTLFGKLTSPFVRL